MTAACALFVVYASLVPFTFVRPHGHLEMSEILRGVLEVRIQGRGNFLANVLLCVPLGFFGTATVVDGQTGLRRWLLAALVVLPAVVAISIAVESAQTFVQGRTPSALDVAAHAIGAATGFVAWAGLGRQTRSLAIRFFRGERAALEVVLTVYVAIQFLRLLEPFDLLGSTVELMQKIDTGGVILDPRASSTMRWDLLPAILSDVLFAIPVGAAAVTVGVAAGSRRRALPAFLMGTLFYLVGETAQVFVRSRSADVVDLTINCLGASAGVLLAGTRLPTRRDAGEAFAWSERYWITGLVGSALFYATYQLTPFDFVFSVQGVGTRLEMLLRVPFSSYYQNAEFVALGEACVKMGLGLPFGLFHRRGDGTSAGRRSMSWLVATGAFFMLVEGGQLFLPSRYPDITDVLIALSGVWIGMHLPRFTRDDDGSAVLADHS